MIRSRRAGAELARLPADDDLLREAAPEGGLRWHTVLVWFVRILSLCWLVKGLSAWAIILGIASSATPFEGASTGYQAVLIYFAVFDLVAAVGLWLTSNWGGVLWLLAVMSHLILAVFFPHFVSNSALVLSLFIFAITIYLIVSWLAAAEE